MARMLEEDDDTGLIVCRPAVVDGGAGTDTQTGGPGDDWLSGGKGADVLAGGAGADIFYGIVGGGRDRVLDFNLADGDRIQLKPGMAFIIRQTADATIIDMGAGDQLVLEGAHLASLAPGYIEVIAHRGLAGGGPEQTMLAFDMAYARGMRSMELDMQVTADGKVVLIHDDTIDRTTNGSGPVKSLTLDQIRSYDVDLRGFTGAKVPTWREFVEWAQTHTDVHVYAEVKSYRTDSDMRLMLDPVKDAGLEDRVTFMSFGVNNLEYLRNIGSSSEMMGLYSAAPDDTALGRLVRIGGAVAASIDQDALKAHPEIIAQARAMGADVAAWTMGSQGQADAMLSLDVHRIVTDLLLKGPTTVDWII